MARSRLALPALSAALLLASPAIAQQLSSDAALGTVLDREGSASVRRVNAQRWTLAAAKSRIEVGDWIKTGTRGANALDLQFGNGKLLLGPKALIEVKSAQAITVLRGEVEVRPGKGETITVHGHGGKTLAFKTRAVVRADDAKQTFEQLKADPRWLTGYRNNASTEAMGSLLAKVDGRNVPLTMGYHKVTVDIRDQIARTTIEESFINRTSGVLEGVFYFPLPQDASISGFGMWIGDELVHGEIVEKQRARAIYEEILREKRDPGLLEWSGGNIFKARVYPIWSEKRIKIVYTQVLPKEGDTYRYDYALQSEMLRTNPLAKLELRVLVDSTTPLAKVEVPSHTCRTRVTGNNASIEFSAEEYTPTRDFELRIQTKPTTQRVTFVPHQRAEEGYFMALVDAPPAPTSAAKTLPALDLVVVADTSGSLTGTARANQIAFIEALLGNLGVADRFNLLTCDSQVRWAFDGPTAADSKTIEAALRFVETRRPLGWTDLDSAFTAALKRVGPKTHVVYVGDGAITTGAADPVAFAQRLTRRYKDQGVFHAVQPGSGAEPQVLRAIASLGSGTVRSIGGGTDPAQVASQLVGDIYAPALTNLGVGVEGVGVAAVYPERLPNLRLGSQHVIVGRYDARGGKQGKLKVSGKLDGKPFNYSAPIQVAAGPNVGNSFVPRLWARMHLDHLLDQGRTPAVKKRVIALSEDFQIITPYTSFLVLESDADRERFKIQKRFRMRDGEEFFAKGRKNALDALRQKQLVVAKRWRQQLRAKLLATLSDMNRRLTELLRPNYAGQLGLVAQGERLEVASRSKNKPGGSLRGAKTGYAAKKEALSLDDADGGVGADEAAGAPMADAAPADGPAPAKQPAPSAPPAEPMPEMEKKADKSSLEEDRDFSGKRMKLRSRRSNRGRFGRRRPGWGWRQPNLQELAKSGFLPVDEGKSAPPPRQRRNPFTQLFPGLGNASPWTAPTPKWSAEINALLTALDRRADVAKLTGALRLTLTSQQVDHRGRVSSWAPAVQVLSKDAWALTSAHRFNDAATTQWVGAGKRGVFSTLWRTGRVRASAQSDLGAWPGLVPWLHTYGWTSYVGMEAALTRLPNDRARIVLTRPKAQVNRWTTNLVTIELDTKRAVVLSVEVRSGLTNENVRKTLFAEFVEVAGRWWPKTIQHLDKDGKVTNRRTLKVEALPAAKPAIDALLVAARAADAVLLTLPLPSREAAKQAIQDKTATAADLLTVLGDLAVDQRWTEADPHAAALLERWKATRVKTALRAIHLLAKRRNQELKGVLTEAITALAAAPAEAEASRAHTLLGWVSSALNRGNETHALLQVVKPVFARQKGVIDPLWDWEAKVIYALGRMGRSDDVEAIRKEQLTRYPFRVDVHATWAGILANKGKVDEALTHLRTAVTAHAPWTKQEQGSFRSAILGRLWAAYRYEPFLEQVLAWGREGILLEVSAYDQQLTALLVLDREPKLNATLQAWLTAWKTDLTPLATRRLQAGIRHALGNIYGFGYSYGYGQIDPSRAKLLAETAAALLEHDTAHVFGASISSNWRFRRTDAARALKQTLWTRLEGAVPTLEVKMLERLIAWLKRAGHSPKTGAAGWKTVMEQVYARWETAAAPEAKRFEQLIARWAHRELQLKRLRKLMAAAKAKPDLATYRSHGHDLYRRLIQGPWTAAAQEEVLTLFALFAPPTGEAAPKPGEALERARNGHVVALYELQSWLTASRAHAEVSALKDVNKLDRRQLKGRREAQLRKTRAAVAELYQRLAKTYAHEYLRDWFAVERVYLLIKAGGARESARTEAHALLKQAAQNAGGETASADLRERVLASRCLATLILLLSDDTPEARKKHLPAVQGLVAQALKKNNKLLDWRQVRYTVLVALDQGAELSTALAAWYGEGTKVAQARWGRALAYILAERDKLGEAIKIFEALGPSGEMTQQEWRQLSDWYLALGKRADADRCKIKSWELQNEWRLASQLRQESYRYRRRGSNVPEDLDADVPLRFKALFRKATRPGNYLYTLRQFYGNTRDFRLLECVPEAVVGQSAQKIYPVLQQFRQIANMLQEEATLDRLVKHLAAIKATAKTPVDRRALELLTYMVQHKAASQRQGGERHAALALAAFKAAFQEGAWGDGEPLLMVRFLSSLGRLRPRELGQEQLRQAEVLARIPTAGTQDHLNVAEQLARIRWNYRLRDEALRGLWSALEARRAASDGRLPASADSALNNYSSYLQQTGAFVLAEKVYLAEIDRSKSEGRRRSLRNRLYSLYENALRQGAQVSIGQGATLYTALRDEFMQRTVLAQNEYQSRQLVQRLVNIMRMIAKQRRYAAIEAQVNARADLHKLAFTGLPKILARFHYRNGQSLVSTVAGALKDVHGYETALEFLVARAEAEPRWLRLRNQDFWPRHGGTVSYYRRQAGVLAKGLERRLLQIVLTALRKDLRHGRSNYASIYRSNHGRNFWRKFETVFAETAREVMAKHEQNEFVLLRVSQYLHDGLRRQGEAIDLLFSWQHQKKLGQQGRVRLVHYLQKARRWDESIPLLDALITERPDVLDHRLRLMKAAHHTGKAARLNAALAAAEAWLKEHKRWQEHSIAQLGRGCLAAGLRPKAVELLEEAVKLRTRSRRNRGVGDSTLSTYYRDLANAYSQMGQTIKAVDAASGAIVSWGSRAYHRSYELNMLEKVLSDAKDLDAYVKHLDATVAKSGLENPILRRAIGKIYKQRGAFEQAETQLGLSLEAKPNDVKTRRMLVEVYDALKRPDQAVEQLLELAKAKGYDRRIYRELGDRYQRAGDAAGAERAYTTMVEMQPNESESHQSLAQVRQTQDRWSDARIHWQQVIRIRTKEPTGYIGLAKVAIRLSKLDEAKAMIEKLEQTKWERRFQSTVRSALRDLRRQVNQGDF